MEAKREKIAPLSIGIVFITLFLALLFYSPQPFANILNYIESISYDLTLRYRHRELSKDSPVIIVDIDDQSLAEVSRWPWSRQKMALLVSHLQKLGAKVIALDFIFPEAEKNLVEELIDEAQSNPSLVQDLDQFKGSFDYDAILAKTLSEGATVLGFTFKENLSLTGELPAPVLNLTAEMEKWAEIPEQTGYLANISILQKAASAGGFINSTPDSDGVIRFTPMLYQHKSKVYPSLSLAAVRLFLKDPEIQLLSVEYGFGTLMEGIQLGNIKIPTDPTGRSLIPFRGPPYSIPYISASDVLKNKVAREKIEGKLVFVGSSATGLGDIVATAISPVFAGVEVHAHTASGILDGYLPYKPNWDRGASIVFILIFGGSLAIALPFLGPLFSFLLTFFYALLLFWIDFFIWKKYGISLSSAFSIFSVLVIYILNGIYGYLGERRRRTEMEAVFGQYVPPECIDSMLRQSGNFGLQGETKELSVLFADIRGFTTLSEGMSATALKNLLNDYLSPMTEVIFNEKGTIDKYIGDMIMAFWGAPLNDLQHAEHAVSAALKMQRKLTLLNETFQKRKWPEIHIGIGVNTGSMNVGDMGSKFRKAYTVLGDAVNLGSRLESLTKYYQVKILVGEETYQKTESLFIYRPIDRVQVKGKQVSTNIYEPMIPKEEATDSILAQVALQKKAFDAYLQRQWAESIALFQQLKTQDPQQKLYDLFLTRLTDYQNNPPPDSWDGSTTYSL